MDGSGAVGAVRQEVDGMLLEAWASVKSFRPRDEDPPPLTTSLHTAHSNATHVGTVELIRVMSETILALEKDGGTPSSPFETLLLTNEVLERLSDVYKIIDNRWFHQEALSEEVVYDRFVQQ